MVMFAVVFIAALIKVWYVSGDVCFPKFTTNNATSNKIYALRITSQLRFIHLRQVPTTAASVPTRSTVATSSRRITERVCSLGSRLPAPTPRWCRHSGSSRYVPDVAARWRWWWVMGMKFGRHRRLWCEFPEIQPVPVSITQHVFVQHVTSQYHVMLCFCFVATVVINKSCSLT